MGGPPPNKSYNSYYHTIVVFYIDVETLESTLKSHIYMRMEMQTGFSLLYADVTQCPSKYSQQDPVVINITIIDDRQLLLQTMSPMAIHKDFRHCTAHFLIILSPIILVCTTYSSRSSLAGIVVLPVTKCTKYTIYILRRSS